MDTDTIKLEHEKITEDIIGAALEVYNRPGYGFLEKAYRRAIQVELIRRGHSAELEHPVKVRFKGVIVGYYHADLLVDGKVIVELIPGDINRMPPKINR